MMIRTPTSRIHSLCEPCVLCVRAAFSSGPPRFACLTDLQCVALFEPAPQCLRASVVLFSGHTSGCGHSLHEARSAALASSWPKPACGGSVTCVAVPPELPGESLRVSVRARLRELNGMAWSPDP